MGGICSIIEEIRNVFKILIGKPEQRQPTRRHGHKLENIFKMDLKEILCEDVDQNHVPEDMDQ